MLLSVSTNFSSKLQWDALFHRIAYDYSRADWEGLCDHLRDVPWEDIFKLSASAAAGDFVSGFRLELMYISLTVNIRPSLTHLYGFQLLVQFIVHRNHFSHLYSQNKVNFGQDSHRCKGVLKAAKLAYANETKTSITSLKLSSQNFKRIAKNVLNKGKSAIPPLFNGPEALSSVSDKAKLFAENFSMSPNLDDSGISLTIFLSITSLKLHISTTPKMAIKSHKVS